jgi:hypothetical protein
MRPRVGAVGAGLLLLAACAEGKRTPAAADRAPPTVLGLRPAQGTARGGDEVCVVGAGLSGATHLWFGDQAQPVHSRSEGPTAAADSTSGAPNDGEACATTPLSRAGVVPVALAVDGLDPIAAGPFTFEPLDLEFTAAAAYYAPTPTGALMDGLVIDLDDDGLDDLLTLDAGGRLAAWRSAGTGALVDGGPVGPRGRVGGFATLRVDGQERVFLCHIDGAAPRLVRAAGGGLRGAAGSAPPEAAACVGAAAVDLDGDGRPEVAELRADGSARLWAIAAGALVPALPLAPIARADCPAIEAAGAASCAADAGVATLTVEGAAAAFVHSLPALHHVDDGFVLQLGGEVDRLEVTDAEGRVYTWRPTGTLAARAVERVETPPVRTWEAPEGAGRPGRPTRPLRSLAVVSSVPPEAMRLNALWGGGALRLSDGAEAPFGGMESWPPDLTGPVRDLATVDSDGDGLAELVAATASGPVLYERLGEAFVPAGPGRMPAVACDARSVEVVDIDEDGVDELFFTCAGQDLIFRGDGTGRYFEDSAATLPVDAGDGRGVASADLDLDGLPELIIATWGGVDRLYHGDGARFDDWSPRLGLTVGLGRLPLTLDLDGDRDLDIVVLQGQGQPARLLLMTGG